MNSDYVIVGNGPAGCIAAKNLSKDFSVKLIGRGDRRVQCAGLLSVSGLERIGVDPKDTVLNTISGAKIFSPNGVELKIDAKKPKAYVVDRMAFDEMLLDQAIDCGIDYTEGFVESVRPEVKVRNVGFLQGDKTVLATGIDYSMHHRLGLETPREFLYGGQYEMEVECVADFVELYFDVPDFFSWVIPVGDYARVGLCVKDNPRIHLDRFVKKLKSQGRLKSDKILSSAFGTIPVHNPSMKTQYDNLYLLGDAAGQVKATSGGGIIMGALAAKHLSSQDYERGWRSEIGTELRLHLLIHRVIHRLSDSGKDRFFKILSSSNSSIESAADMDMASKTILSVVKDPAFMARMAFNMPMLLYDML